MPSKPVEFAPEAHEELLQASAYYEGKQAGLGDDFLDCVEEGLRRIGEAPEAHSPAGFEEVRLARIRRFPYHLPFLELPEEIRVLAVAHVRRRPAYWRGRLDGLA